MNKWKSPSNQLFMKARNPNKPMDDSCQIALILNEKNWEIEQLKAEITRLKAENEKLNQSWNISQDQISDAGEHVYGLMNEIERLKETIRRHNSILWDGCPAYYSDYICPWSNNCEMKKALEADDDDACDMECNLQEYLDLEIDLPKGQS